MDHSNRRQFLAGTALLGVAATASLNLHAESSESPKVQPTMPKLIHKVFFWLKNPDSREDRDKLIAGIKSLAAIETVRAIHVGVPASTEKRDVVDNSFDVSEMLGFDDVEGQNIYQVHPLHQKFVEEHSHLWRKVVVYDSMAV
ncbi:MAG: Dabb family protein [Cellvibrio sp.]|jgi:hypothetical protein